MPTIIKYHHGKKFIGRVFKENLIKKYGIKPKCETMANMKEKNTLEKFTK